MLDAEAIRACLEKEAPSARPRVVGCGLRALGSVTSTSDVAWAWAEAGCAEGTAVLAEEQVSGRGRFGRAWQCPRGRGLLMSVVFRPPAELPGPAHLTSVGALALAEAVEAAAGLPAAIRWPNDVVCRGRKLAGVLVETRGSGGPSPCVMGLGLNVNTRREEFPEELRGRATSLAIEAGRDFEIERIAAAVLGRLDARYGDARDGRWADVAARWRERSSLVGEGAAVESGGQTYRGRVLDADPLRGIELELADGERRVFRAERTTLVLPPLAVDL